MNIIWKPFDPASRTWADDARFETGCELIGL